MTHRVLLALLLAIFAQLSPPTSAQMTSDEAMARLMAHEAAATQPSDQSAEILMLKSVIADQRRQIAELHAEIEQLKAAPPLTPMAAKVHPKSTFTSRIKESLANPSLVESDERRKADLEAAKKIDSDIDAYGAANNLPTEMIEAMHEGRPMLKMPEAALRLFTECHTESESLEGKTELVWSKYSGGLPTYTVTISGGYVVEIEHPDSIGPGPSGSFDSGSAENLAPH